jgi:hypothetical protein
MNSLPSTDHYDYNTGYSTGLKLAAMSEDKKYRLHGRIVTVGINPTPDQSGCEDCNGTGYFKITNPDGSWFFYCGYCDIGG